MLNFVRNNFRTYYTIVLWATALLKEQNDLLKDIKNILLEKNKTKDKIIDINI